MTPADEERRHEARLSPGDLGCHIEGASFAHVLGVTVGGHGMRVLTDQRLATDRPLHVVVHLSDTEDLEFTGQVVWDEDKNFEYTHRFISGLKFLASDARNCSRLHDFIERHTKDENKGGGDTGSLAP